MRRKKSVLVIILGLVLLGGFVRAQAQTPVTLMEWTNQWRYLITNALPAGFSASNYPAANGWPMGPGPLSYSGSGHETFPAPIPPSSTLLATNFNNMFVTSFYFRTTITLTSNPTNTAITGTAAVDDGAVFYVNGREVQRLGMATGAVTHNTFANRGGEVVDANRVETFSLASSNFVQGVNVIAVSVHQQNGTSSDVAFAMRITALVSAPIVITEQPEDQTVDAGQRATFSVTASGSAPRYQWFSNNVAIADATNMTYQTPVTTLAMNGRVYHVVVSNQLNSVRSANAVLTVVVDKTGPVPVSAVVETLTNRVLITFNEALLNNSVLNPLINRNPTNFFIYILGTTNRIGVTNVEGGGSQLRVHATNGLNSSSNYVLGIYNVVDVRTNAISPNPSYIGIGFNITTNIFPIGSEWHFQTLIGDNTLHDTNWTDANFDDSEFASPAWGIANGAFFEDVDAPLDICSIGVTSLLKGPRTHYFRKRFTLGSSTGWLTNLTVTIRHQIDDGAIFHINGAEIGRYNMPAGPFDYFTIASSEVTNPGPCLTFQAVIPLTLLNFDADGTNNVLAVEVHQQEGFPGGTAGDVHFDADMSLNYRFTPPIPELSVARVRQGNFTNILVRWVGSSEWKLQHAVNLSGPWTNLTSGISVIMGTNQYQANINTLGARRFYRVRNP